jgi:hypothetical protein
MAGIDDVYTKALLHMDGANASTTFTDESGKTWTARGDAQLTTAQYKFSPSSGNFDGNGDWIDTPHNTDFVFGAGDFTIDFWVRTTAAGEAGNSTLLAKVDNVSHFCGYEIVIFGGGYAARLYMSSAGTSFDLANSAVIGTLTQNVWAHIAVCRLGTNVYTYLNGVWGSTSAVSTTALYDNSYTLLVGGGNFANSYHTGQIDEVRISKGIARWSGTGSFTPPTAPYGPPQGTPVATAPFFMI